MSNINTKLLYWTFNWSLKPAKSQMEISPPRTCRKSCQLYLQNRSRNPATFLRLHSDFPNPDHLDLNCLSSPQPISLPLFMLPYNPSSMQ